MTKGTEKAVTDVQRVKLRREIARNIVNIGNDATYTTTGVKALITLETVRMARTLTSGDLLRILRDRQAAGEEIRYLNNPHQQGPTQKSREPKQRRKKA